MVIRIIRIFSISLGVSCLLKIMILKKRVVIGLSVFKIVVDVELMVWMDIVVYISEIMVGRKVIVRILF